MRSIEATGRSVEEAKRKAAEQLGVGEDDIEFEVLEVGGKSGLFGLFGGSQARVRATFYETRRHSHPHPHSSPRQGNVSQSDDDYDARPPRGRSRQKSGNSQNRPRNSGQDRQSSRPPRISRQQEMIEVGGQENPSPRNKPSNQGGQDRSRNKPGGRNDRPQNNQRPQGESQQGRNQGGQRDRRDQRQRSQQTASQSAPAEQKIKTGADAVSMEQRAQEAQTIVKQLVDAGDLQAAVAITNQTDDGFDIEITGGNSQALVGRGGQTLDSLQFLIGIIINRKYESKLRISVDAADYRKRHKETLEKTALELADQVVEHNQEAELEPLPARDRLIIHNILKDHPKVKTYSEGEGNNRYVVISPKSDGEA